MYNQYPFTSFNPSTFSNAANPSGVGGLLGLGKKFTWDGFLTNAQKTLNVVNQALPIYNQVKPMFRNMGTVFKVMSELNKSSTNTTAATNASDSIASTTNNSNPKFFA